MPTIFSMCDEDATLPASGGMNTHRHSTDALNRSPPQLRGGGTKPPIPAKRKSIELLAAAAKKRHPLSHSQETVLYTDDSYDPQPILPNRQPNTPNVWVPIPVATATVIRA